MTETNWTFGCKEPLDSTLLLLLLLLHVDIKSGRHPRGYVNADQL